MENNQLDIEQLVQDDHNFNKGTKKGQEVIVKSFKRFGAGRSILLDKDNRIIAGNKSHLAAQDAGIKSVRVIETDGSELIAVKRTDVSLDSKEGREMALADNATTILNLEWNKDELQYAASMYEGFDIPEWGLDIPDLLPQKECKEDNFDPNDETIPTRCQPGEVWVMGDHRLLCGDATSTSDVARLMAGEKAQLLITDPPYNVNIVGGNGKTIINDNMKSHDFKIFLEASFSAISTALDEGCPFYVWFASREHYNFVSSLEDNGLGVRQELVWNKNMFTLGRSHYQWKHEPCLYGWKGDVCRYFCGARNRASVLQGLDEIDIDKMSKADMATLLKKIFPDAGNNNQVNIPTTVINENKPTRSEEHPTMKPVRLFGYQINNSSRDGDIILDPFGGSGTTMVACEQLGRKAYLMELDPHYCDVILSRWEKLTGRQAVKK